MHFIALLIGFFYGHVSVKGQFCMNSGFSDVFRKKDMTKLKSFILAILIQMLVLPFIFSLLFEGDSTRHFVGNLGLPPLFFAGSAIGGFLFGVFMHYTGGCGAGIFFKIGEKNTGAGIAVAGFVGGIYLMEMGWFSGLRVWVQQWNFNQQPFWQGNVAIPGFFSMVSGILMFLLLRMKDHKPNGASWGWKKTGIAVGFIGILGWLSALYEGSSYGLSIMPGIMDALRFQASWGLLFVIGIPLGAFWSSRKSKEKRFSLPKADLMVRRFFGGMGLGVSGSVAAGCTVGHGLTFSPLLGAGSFVTILFIFLGSGLMGYITRK